MRIKKEGEKVVALSYTAEKFNKMKIFKRPSDLTVGKPITSRTISVDVGGTEPHRVELENEGARSWDCPVKVTILSAFAELLLGSFEPEVRSSLPPPSLVFSSQGLGLDA